MTQSFIFEPILGQKPIQKAIFREISVLIKDSVYAKKAVEGEGEACPDEQKCAERGEGGEELAGPAEGFAGMKKSSP